MSRAHQDLVTLAAVTRNPWQTTSRSIAFDNGRFAVRVDQVIQPDGTPGTYTYIELPTPVVAAVPVDAEGRVYLVRQWRYPWDRPSWEIPAGHCESGESLEDAIRREIAEEAGLAVGRLELLGGSMHASALITVPFHLYLARDLTPAAGQRDSSEADMLVQPFGWDEAIEAAMDGTIVHAATIVGLLRAARLLHSPRPDGVSLQR